MTTAKKIVDWHGQGGEDLAREFDELPEGRYALIPENELEEEAAEDLDLTPEQIEGLKEGLERFKRGEPGVPLEEARARIRAHLEAARR